MMARTMSVSNRYLWISKRTQVTVSFLDAGSGISEVGSFNKQHRREEGTKLALTSRGAYELAIEVECLLLKDEMLESQLEHFNVFCTLFLDRLIEGQLDIRSELEG